MLNKSLLMTFFLQLYAFGSFAMEEQPVGEPAAAEDDFVATIMKQVIAICTSRYEKNRDISTQSSADLKQEKHGFDASVERAGLLFSQKQTKDNCRHFYSLIGDAKNIIESRDQIKIDSLHEHGRFKIAFAKQSRESQHKQDSKAASELRRGGFDGKTVKQTRFAPKKAMQGLFESEASEKINALLSNLISKPQQILSKLLTIDSEKYERSGLIDYTEELYKKISSHSSMMKASDLQSEFDAEISRKRSDK